ncbi:malonyl CoA-acyl carrier protein transacylase [Agarivorans gilvus]|jgi:[acyl-carrier-protein] S-malonyltransferase|uniref:Malonyl CoA-acyl carrier protein transacylase n=2 Tax=Agarivorans gilvus TaxID=680279 RepID=A0ABQ1HZL3_9ALTE|nr:malonyl CoA-acyl carrier protein transacylase [Agarivorans gilvus]
MMSKLAFVFPGQGSQSVGMLAELVEEYPIVADTFKEASEVLGYDLAGLIANGPAESLNETSRTQPALLAASVALWRLWNQLGGEQPKLLAGHSLGEYSALTCAGVLEFADALKLVEYRGQLMQQAVPAGVGAMSAIIGLANQDIIDACEKAAEDQVVTAVNFNSPGQVVIAGHKEAVERANVLCKEAGAKRALPLPVSVPSHCALMQPAADELAGYIEGISFSEPKFDVINNVDVAIEKDAKAIKSALIKQLYSPVRWTETVEAMAAKGIDTVYECGPGKVLSGLVKRIHKPLVAAAINDVTSIKSALDNK